MKKSLSTGVVLLAVMASLVGARAQTTATPQNNTPPASTKAEQAAGEQSKAPADKTKESNRERRREVEATIFYREGVDNALAGHRDQAIEYFKQAIQLNPKYADAYFSLGNLYFELERWNEAIEVYKQAAHFQLDSEAYNKEGLAHVKLGQFEQAIEAFKRAIQIHPKWAEPYFNQGQAYENLGRHKEARAAFEQAVRLKPEYASRVPPSNTPAQSKAIPEDSHKAALKTPEATEGEKAKGNPPARTSNNKPVDQSGPKNAKGYYNQGVKYGRSGQFDESVEAFKQAIKLKPDYADAYAGLGQAYSSLGRWREAIEAYEQVVRLDPKDDEAYARLGEAYVKSRAQTAAAPSQDGIATKSVEKTTESVTSNTNPPVAPSKEINTSSKETKTPPEEKKANAAASVGPTKTGTSAGAKTETPAATKTETPNAQGTTPAKGEAEVKTVAASVTATGTPPVVTVAKDPTSVYLVGTGDVLDIRLLNAPPQPTTLFTITPAGLLEYTLLGQPLQVAGLTTDEIDAKITAGLKSHDISKNPEVVVAVSEYASHGIIISGLVMDPGTKILRREAVPLYVIVADAQPHPKANQATITSHVNGQKKIVDLADAAAMSTLVYPGDVVTVGAQPRARQFFYLSGQIRTPGQKDFYAGMTLTQALLAAGRKLSDGGKVKIVRQGANGLLVTTLYDIKSIVEGQAPDPFLKPDDRVEVR